MRATQTIYLPVNGGRHMPPMMCALHTLISHQININMSGVMWDGGRLSGSAMEPQWQKSEKKKRQPNAKASPKPIGERNANDQKRITTGTAHALWDGEEEPEPKKALAGNQLVDKKPYGIIE